MIVGSALAIMVTLVAIYLVWSRWALDIVALFCLSVLLFYGFRVLFVAIGLDDLFLERVLSHDADAITRTNTLIAIFLFLTFIGLVPGSAIRGPATKLFPAIDRQLDINKLFAAIAVLTAGTFLIMAILLIRYGGFGAMVRAAKVEKELAGTYVLKVIPSVGAMVALAGVLESRRRRSQQLAVPAHLRVGFLCFTVLNAAAVLAWGARSVLVVVGFGLLTGLAVFGKRSMRRRLDHRGLVTRLVVIGVLVGALIFGLRIWRDVVLTGEVNQTISDQTLVRQVSVATNMTQYDAFVLAARDFPSRYELRDGADFANGAIAWVPRVIWTGKPEQVVPGRWFRHVYDTEHENGWPMGTTGEWYLNFGIAGVVAGGFLTGIMIGIARTTYRRAGSNPFNFVCSVVVAFLVLDGGVNSQTPTQWLAWCAPLILVGLWSRGRLRRSTDAPGIAVPVQQ